MRLNRERWLLLALLAAAIAVWWLAWGELADELVVTVLDAGQGDSILVQVRGGRTILVDGGGAPRPTSGWDVGREVVVPALMARGVKRLDVLVITHPHEDHVGGLPAVIEAVPVGLVLDPMLEDESASYGRLRELLAQRGIPVQRATEGQRLNLGGSVYADVLNPPDPRLAGTGSDANNNSVVLRLVHGQMSVLLTGDIDRVGVLRVARLGAEVRSVILKVPHHGSEGSAAPEFLDAVAPELAVISVGDGNPFGHPSSKMLRELERVGAKIMRTDHQGAVTIRVTPTSWSARGFADRRTLRRAVQQPVGAGAEAAR